MISINNYIDNLDFSTNLEKVNTLLCQKATGNITWWGKRVVRIEGYTGYVALDTLAEKIQRSAIDYTKKNNLSPIELLAGKEITDHVSRLYRKTDTTLKTKNIFTRIFNAILEFSFFQKPRSFLERAKQQFMTVSKDNVDKFLEKLTSEHKESFISHCKLDENSSTYRLYHKAFIMYAYTA